MGGACSSESKMETGNANKNEDLPAIDMKGKDFYEKFELQMPFSKILIKDFAAKVEQAHIAEGK